MVKGGWEMLDIFESPRKDSTTRVRVCVCFPISLGKYFETDYFAMHKCSLLSSLIAIIENINNHLVYFSLQYFGDKQLSFSCPKPSPHIKPMT